MTKKNILFSILLLAHVSFLFAQSDFVLSTRYDNLTWSPDGKEIAFRCVLLDESNPNKITSNLLLKNLLTDQLICLNPQPEQFVVSQHKKRLLFSSAYGLYLKTLDSKSVTIQVLFRDPTVSWIFKSFGFYNKDHQIFVEKFDYLSNETVREFFSIAPFDSLSDFVTVGALIKIEKKLTDANFSLPTDGFSSEPVREIKLNDRQLRFVEQPGENRGQFNFVFLGEKKDQSRLLLKSCRPRLLSANSDKSKIIVSVFAENKHSTYLFDAVTAKLSLMENKRYFSVVWLTNQQFCFLTEDGLFFRDFDRKIEQKLDNWNLPTWCQNIRLEQPRFELQIGFVETEIEADAQINELFRLGFIARKMPYKNKEKSGFRIRVGGYGSKADAKAAGEKLRSQNYSYWIDKITDQFDFYNSQPAPEARQFDDKIVQIEYKKDLFLRSRIVLLKNDKVQTVIVGEMNNIPSRRNWE